MLAVCRLTAADVPGVSDIAGEVVRQAAADGRDGTLFKSTAPGPQPRRAGSTAIHEISALPGGRRAATANPAGRIWQPRGSAWPGPGPVAVAHPAGGRATGTMRPAAAARPRRPGSLWVPRRPAASQVPAATTTL